MRTILIDDLRNIGADVVCRTFDEGIHALKNDGPFGVLFLDHDLGHLHPKTGQERVISVDGYSLPMNGYGIMKFLELKPELKPKKIICVSSNPPGKARIEMVIKKLYETD